MAEKQHQSGTCEAVFMIDEADIITGCNQAVEEIFGWPVSDIKGKIFSETVLPSDIRKLHKDSLSHPKENDGKYILFGGIEQNVLHRDGYEFPAELNICQVERVPDSSFIITARDIRDKKQRIDVLKQAHQNQKTVNSILKITLGDYSLKEILLQSLESVLQLETPKLLNKGAILLLAEESDHLVLMAHKGFDKKQVKVCTQIPLGVCHCGRAALTGEIQYAQCVDDKHDIKLASMKPHGHYCVPICSTENLLGVMSLYIHEGHVQNDEEKEILRAVSNILAGVIERKRNEIQRHRLIEKQEAMITRVFDEKKLTESIIQSLSAGLMVFDVDGKIVKLNPSGRLILGQFGDFDASRAGYLERIAEIPIVKRMWESYTPRTEDKGEFCQMNSKGEKRTLKYTVVPWENSSGRHIGAIFQFKDLTDKLRLQQEMEKMNRLSTVAEIASAVAHEVRNPLAGIKTMSQAIAEKCEDDDENKEYITRIIKQVDRLNGLLTEFFTYARPGKAKKDKVSMSYIVNEIRQLLKVKLDSKHIVLEEDYAKKLPDIYVDPDQMQQVFLNLMLNSIDAMGKNGRIEIRARMTDRKLIKSYKDFFPELKKNVDYVAVYFKDNGKGMAPEVMDKAFEPFYTTKHHGSGLGLAIVSRIISENNAFIMIDPSHKKGVAYIMMFESVHS